MNKNDDIMFLKKISDGNWYSPDNIMRSKKSFLRMVNKWKPILDVKRGRRKKIYVRVKKEYGMSMAIILQAWGER